MSAALVTGATGMLGSYVVQRLVEKGWRVRALARRPSSAAWLEELGADVVAGDVLDPCGLRRAAEGSELVVHAAAAIGAGDGARPYDDVNVLGTGNVAEAAGEVGARLVHVSSTAVFGRHRWGPAPTDESVPLPRLPRWDAYGRSKQEGERVVLEAHARGRVSAVVVRPPVMYGRRDRQFVPRIAPVLLRGVFPVVRGGRATLSLVHVSAVADGIHRAARTPEAAGRIYHLTDDFALDVAALIRLASRGLGRPVWTPEVPARIARLGFGALAGALILAGRRGEARHAPGTFDMLTRDNPFTSRRARQELGWAPSLPPETGIPDAFRWWRVRRGLLALLVAGAAFMASPAATRAQRPFPTTCPSPVAGADGTPGIVERVARAMTLAPPEARAALASLEGEARVAAGTSPPGDAGAAYALAAVLGARAEVAEGSAQLRLAGEAYEHATRTLTLDRDHAGAHHILGRLHAGAMRLGGMKRFLARKLMGAAVLDAATWTSARIHLERAERLDPCVPDHHYELARLYSERGARAEALRELAHVFENAAGGGTGMRRKASSLRRTLGEMPGGHR